MARIPSFYILFLCIVMIVEIFFGTLLHEGAHWLSGELLGYDMKAGIGRAWPVDPPRYQTLLDELIIIIAGPLVTLLFAIMGACFVIFRGAVWGYTFVFAAWFMRTLAMVISAINNFNDEARFSILLGWEWWVVPSLMVGVLTLLLVYTGKRAGITWKLNLLFYMICSVGFSLVVFFDGQFPGFRHASPVVFP